MDDALHHPAATAHDTLSPRVALPSLGWAILSQRKFVARGPGDWAELGARVHVGILDPLFCSCRYVSQTWGAQVRARHRHRLESESSDSRESAAGGESVG
jgi:hypothetical protein